MLDKDLQEITDKLHGLLRDRMQIVERLMDDIPEGELKSDLKSLETKAKMGKANSKEVEELLKKHGYQS